MGTQPLPRVLKLLPSQSPISPPLHPGNARFVQNADYIKVPFNTLTLTLTNTHPKPTY